MAMRNILAWILFLIGFAGVIIPHTGFIASVPIFSNLNQLSHAGFEIFSGILMLVAFAIKK